MHLKGKTECFECQPRPAPKGFPICTIRNTPEKPIHCIVWAKDLLFERLFGAPEETNDLDEVTAEDMNASEADKAAAAGAVLATSIPHPFSCSLHKHCAPPKHRRSQLM